MLGNSGATFRTFTDHFQKHPQLATTHTGTCFPHDIMMGKTLKNLRQSIFIYVVYKSALKKII